MQLAGSAARYALIAIRLYLGAWMLLNGLNHFLPIFPQPMGGPGSSQSMATLIETGLFGLVKGAEIVVGVLLLLDIFVPVALVISMPISVIVWFNQAFLGRGLFMFHMSTGCLVYSVILLIAYIRYFLPMMRMQTNMGELTDFRQIGQVFAAADISTAPPEAKYRVLVFCAGLIATAVLFYQLHPWTPQLAGAGKTPATIIGNYMQLAYDDGKRAVVDEMYLSPRAIEADKHFSFPQNGKTLGHRIVSIVAQGQNVDVYQVVDSGPGGAPEQAVDIYKVERSQITNHVRVTAASAGNGR